MRISSFYLKKACAMDRLLMILEDQEHKTQELREALGSYWETIYKWSWPLATDAQFEAETWEVGDTVDALDRINVWGPAVIIGKRLALSADNPLVFEVPETEEFEVRFHGWSIGFNEWVPASKLARLGTKSINPRNLFQSLPDLHSSWALCQHGGAWEMESLIVQDVSGNTRILSTGNKNLSVTAENVTNYVRASSNATTYLLIAGRRFRPDGRNLAL